tara:strand:+ start:685 stop:1926 length:1242 start_codon:yes stop_codon:yes gene_type:complete
MKKRRLAVVGRGTAGCISMLQLLEDRFHYHNAKDKLYDNIEHVDWYYDPSIPTAPVGEGTTITFPDLWNRKLGASYCGLDEVDYQVKEGIYYQNWGKTDFMHTFPIGTAGAHFNAKKFQHMVFNRLEKHPQIRTHAAFIPRPLDVEEHEGPHDKIIYCAGKPDLEDCIIPDYIPVNAAHITQCPWDAPKFRHTKTIAMPFGWVFMVPLANRCSVGYLYNKDINTADEVRQDVVKLWGIHKLDPDYNSVNNIEFNNYYRKKFFDGKVVYNGNAGFFLEPMEATSIDTMLRIIQADRSSDDEEHANEKMHIFMKDAEMIIMIHYAAGSKYKTPFWEFAQERGIKCLEEARKDRRRSDILRKSEWIYHEEGSKRPTKQFQRNIMRKVGPWNTVQLKLNMANLGLDPTAPNYKHELN